MFSGVAAALHLPGLFAAIANIVLRNTSRGSDLPSPAPSMTPSCHSARLPFFSRLT